MKIIEEIKKILVNLCFDGFTPNEREYKKKIKQIQREELNTERFKTINDVISCLTIRDYRYKEEEIFSKLDYFKNYIDGKNVNPSYYEACCLAIWANLRKIATSITYEQEDSNPYIMLFTKFMTCSLGDCKNIIDEVNEKYPNISMDCLGTIFEVKLNITNKLKNILPSYASKTVAIPSTCSEKEFDYVNRLSEKHMHIYDEYNDFVAHVLEMAETIYRLRLFQMLRNKDIAPLYFNILNNEVESGLFISFYYRKYIKVDEQKNLAKFYNDKIQKNIGLNDYSFEEIINMDDDDIERYAANIFGMPRQYMMTSVSDKVEEQNDEIVDDEESQKKHVLEMK